MKGGARTEFERDYDRILFSAPVRRLADKTQVFPLEQHDAVRTRLTHSHEVSNIARSMGTDLAAKGKLFPAELDPIRNVSALLAAIGLAHDLGNPPFGHQGEKSIQKWFAEKRTDVLNSEDLTAPMKADFLQFQGNAQTLRLVTRLQIINDDFGLNLTYGTLSALMKYTVPSNKTAKDENHPEKAKPGFFQSEVPIVDDVRSKTGLTGTNRHPLTYLLEAADDLAYTIVDAEDAAKKGLVSFADVVAYLQHGGSGNGLIKSVVERANADHVKYRSLKGLSVGELDDITMQKFRVYACDETISAATRAYVKHFDEIMDGSFKGDLITASEAAEFCVILKRFDREFAYKHEAVRRIELQGHNVIWDLMDMMWDAITDRENAKDLRSQKKGPFSNYVYSRISENYRRIFEDESNNMPMRYKELQLITDMLAGMTDSFAMRLHGELSDLRA